MKIAIDYRPALEKGTGVGTFVEHLAMQLASERGLSLHLFSSSFKSRLQTAQWNNTAVELHDQRFPVKILNFFWHRLRWPPVDLFTGRVDISLSPTPLIIPSAGKKIITLHDLYFMKKPGHTTGEIRRDYPALIEKSVRDADGILAVSNATKSDAVEILGIPAGKITVCHEDISEMFDEPADEASLAGVEKEFGKQFFLFVGTIEPRKNLVPLLQAFEEIADETEDVTLVIAGDRGWGTDAFDEQLRGMRHQDRVRVTGYCSREQLRALYQRATALIMPSHCEGFGLPLLEAMASRCPVITRQVSAMPEVAGDAALYWDGSSHRQLARLMQSLRADQQLRSELTAKGLARRKKFSWKKTAEIVIDLCRSLL